MFSIPEDPELLGDEIARTAAHIDAATHRLLTCIRAFDASGRWERQGTVSCAHWLSWRIGLRPAVARDRVRVARALGALPLIDDALRQGALSYCKVRALARVATPTNEQHLLAAARFCTGAQLERLCRGLRSAVAVTAEGDRLDEHRTLREEHLENGMVRLTAVLHADEAALVMKAIEHARRPRGPATSVGGVSAESAETSSTADRTVSPAGRPLAPAVDALMTVAETYLAHHDATRPGGPRTQIVLHLDEDPLAAGGLAASLDDGTRVSAETLRRLSCDASLVPARHTDQGPRLDLGRRTRTISPALRRALALRDRGCSFPGCPHHFFLHAHHIQHWFHGGPTSLENLVLLCTAHHRLVHEGGFGLSVADNGTPAFTDPRGRPIPAVPPPCKVDNGDVLFETNERAGLLIDAQTGLPGWDGERIDYAWALDAFLRESSAD
jgi:hypothetical protein